MHSNEEVSSNKREVILTPKAVICRISMLTLDNNKKDPISAENTHKSPKMISLLLNLDLKSKDSRVNSPDIKYQSPSIPLSTKESYLKKKLAHQIGKRKRSNNPLKNKVLSNSVFSQEEAYKRNIINRVTDYQQNVSIAQGTKNLIVKSQEFEERSDNISSLSIEKGSTELNNGRNKNIRDDHMFNEEAYNLIGEQEKFRGKIY